MLTLATERKKPIGYGTLAFFILVPLITFTGMIIYFSHKSLPWQTITEAVVLYGLLMFSITAGYHRLFSHRTYEASVPVKIFFLLFGAAAFQKSALWWAKHHRDHHAYTDTDKDPHDIKKGFFFAHMGWILPKNPINLKEEKNITDLLKDPWVVFQDRHCTLIGLIVGVILPALLGFCWGDFWGALIFAVGLRMVLVSHATFCINSLAHMIGNRPHNKLISARDNYIMALITFGEGYHNYHHAFPSDYRNGKKHYNFDPSKWMIFLMSQVGLTKNLRRAGE